MKMPSVSVIVPVYNGGKYVDRAVESALAQTYHCEIIAVNDGSTDDSRQILGRYESRIRVIDQRNQGVSMARNTGLQEANGELVCFLDQDDWWLPQKVEKQVECFVQDSGLGLVHTGVLHFDDVLQDFVGPLSPGSRPDLVSGECYERLVTGNSIYNSSVMIQRSVLDKVGFFATAISGNSCQDYDLWLRIAKVARFGFVSDAVTVFRLHPGQGTWNRPRILSDELTVLARIMADEDCRLRDKVRGRMAEILDELGVAHLDGRNRKEARRCFRQLLQIRPSARGMLLYGISMLPCMVGDWLRSAWGRMKGAPAGNSGRPEWAMVGVTKAPRQSV